MAGTPTQYYGFPTYADSDAVDLTAQYNSAMINIDSELHQVELMAEFPKSKIILLGDSWTQSTWGDNLVARLRERFNANVYNYGVSGAVLSSTYASAPPSYVTDQAERAASDHADDVIDLVLIIAGVNDFGRSDFKLTDFYNGLNATCTAIGTIKTVKRVVWLPNGSINANTDAMTNIKRIAWSEYQFPRVGCLADASMILGMLAGKEAYYNEDGLHPSDGPYYPNLVVNTLTRQGYSYNTIGSGADVAYMRHYNCCGISEILIQGGKTISVSLDTKANVAAAMYLTFMVAGQGALLNGMVVGDGQLVISNTEIRSTFTGPGLAAVYFHGRM